MLTRKDLKFVGVDYWSRPVFKSVKGYYYCCVDQLQDDNATEADAEEVLKNIDSGYHYLYGKGRDFDGEPGSPVQYKTEAPAPEEKDAGE